MFRCKICDKTFSSRFHKERHEDTHNPPTLQCQVCKKAFRRQTHLVRHEKTHYRRTEPSAKVCVHCGKSFTTTYRLKRHEAGHDEPKFICELCDRRFHQSGHLNRHRASAHVVPATKSGTSTDTVRPEEYPTSSLPLPSTDSLHFDESVEIPSDWPETAADLMRENWAKIRTSTISVNRRVEEFNMRITPTMDVASTLKLWMREVHGQQTHKYRVNLQFGYFLTRLPETEEPSAATSELQHPTIAETTETEEASGTELLRHYYSSTNTKFFTDESPFIYDRGALETQLSRLDTTDLIEWATANRENSHWSFLAFTNVKIRIVKLLRHPIRGGVEKLPAFITVNKNIFGLLRNRDSGKLYDDDKCIFRCLALTLNCNVSAIETMTDSCFRRWCEHKSIALKDFDGVTVDQIPEVEKLFQVRMSVWEFVLAPQAKVRGSDSTCGSTQYSEDELDAFAARYSDGDGDLYEELAFEEVHETDVNAWQVTSVTLSKIKPQKNIPDAHVLLYKNHFCFIRNIDSLLQSFQCPKCAYVFPKRGNFNRHVDRCKGVKVEHKFPGGGFHMPRTLFEKLELFDIFVPAPDRFRSFFAVFDSESFQKETASKPTGKLEFMGECVPASFAVAPKIPGFRNASCFVSDGDAEELSRKLIQQLSLLQTEAAQTLLQTEAQQQTKNTDKYEPYLTQIQTEIARLESLAVGESPRSLFFRKRSLELRKLSDQFERIVQCLPVFTFNGAKFDIPLLRKYLFPKLIKEKKMGHVIKKNSGYISLSVGHILFLDAANFLAAGCSYDQMLKSFKVTHSKFFWPYDWFVSLEQLSEKNLPKQEKFFNRLKQKGISNDDYKLVQDTWTQRGWETMRDYLIFYNIQDVEPFVEAIEKMCGWWRDHNIDMLSQGVSLPSLALRHLHNHMKPGFVMPLVNEANADLFWTMRNGVVGGPSFVFHRYHEKNVTKIRGDGKMCAGICGLDCNGLYLWCTMQELPMSVFYRWRRNEDGTLSRSNMYEKSLKETQWLTWMAYNQNCRIHHKFNGGQIDFGCGGMFGKFKKVPVDGYCPETKTIFQFLGCHWHSHGCDLDRSDPGAGRRDQTEQVNAYLRSLGYKVEYVRECEFDREVKDASSGVAKFLRERFDLKFDGRSTAGDTEIIDAVKRGDFFGMVEVDIETSDTLKEKFSEFQPIFKNREVSRDDLSGYTADYASEHNLLKRPQQMLLGSYMGEKMLLITPLLRWYLSEGLVVTKVYQAFQAVGSSQINDVGEGVAQARRDADADPNQKMRGEMSKTVGNCFYGRAITDITRHKEVSFCCEDGVERMMRDPRFSDLDCISEDTYEISMRKKIYTFNLPFILGVFVYQYAKLRMLAFFHNFLAKYIPRDCFQLCQMDTDSFYIALAGENLDELVPTRLKMDYLREKHDWLPREDTPENKAFDKRKPGLFKVEWRGDGLISLASKLYYGWSDAEGPKIACKGVRRLNDCISKQNFERTLKTGNVISGENMGFRMHGNVLKAYLQKKSAITGFYAKRPLEADGVTTRACLL